MPTPGLSKVRRHAGDGVTAGRPPLRSAPGGAPLRRVGRPLGHRTAASDSVPASSPIPPAHRFAAFAGLPPTSPCVASGEAWAASGPGLRQKGSISRISRADNKD